MNSAELRDTVRRFLCHPMCEGENEYRFRLTSQEYADLAAALERLEALEAVVRFPTAVVMHRDGPVVVCDDGTVWWWSSDLNEWNEYDPIPGTRAATPAPAGQQGGEG